MVDDTASGPVEKIYAGRRMGALGGQRGRCSVSVHEHGDTRPLPHPCESPAECHSPDGFEWGYAGSGPAELARCILWDHLGFDPPRPIAQRFKTAFIAPAPHNGFRISSEQIARWLGREVPPEGGR